MILSDIFIINIMYGCLGKYFYGNFSELMYIFSKVLMELWRYYLVFFWKEEGFLDNLCLVLEFNFFYVIVKKMGKVGE